MRNLILILTSVFLARSANAEPPANFRQSCEIKPPLTAVVDVEMYRSQKEGRLALMDASLKAAEERFRTASGLAQDKRDPSLTRMAGNLAFQRRDREKFKEDMDRDLALWAKTGNKIEVAAVSRFVSRKQSAEGSLSGLISDIQDKINKTEYIENGTFQVGTFSAPLVMRPGEKGIVRGAYPVVEDFLKFEPKDAYTRAKANCKFEFDGVAVNFHPMTGRIEDLQVYDPASVRSGYPVAARAEPAPELPKAAPTPSERPGTTTPVQPAEKGRPPQKGQQRTQQKGQ